ncbi:hypothetical protein HBI07_251390 [Parastagonospora nodorum]|nr:hypothetical protein HBI07_251390 [Parastagonospora nodorum]
MQRETRTYLRYTLSKELKLTLNILLLGPNKSLLFLALACLKDLGVLVILSSEELSALVMLRLLGAPSNSVLKSTCISRMQRGNK